MGWIGVDLDGTLAEYDGWKGEDHIGAPIPEMVERVVKWLDQGMEVRIFTARASKFGRTPERRAQNILLIQRWTKEHLGRYLLATSDKDFECISIWDDRAVRVEFNTGIPLLPEGYLVE